MSCMQSLVLLCPDVPVLRTDAGMSYADLQIRGGDEGKSSTRGIDGWPPGPFKSLGPGPLRAPLGPLRAWAQTLVGPPGPLWAPLGPCGPVPCGPSGPLWDGPLWDGPCGPPWALVGSPGPLWAGPLWAPLGPRGPGANGPLLYTYIYIYTSVGPIQ